MALSDSDVGGTRAFHALSNLLPSSGGDTGRAGTVVPAGPWPPWGLKDAAGQVAGEKLLNWHTFSFISQFRPI